MSGMVSISQYKDMSLALLLLESPTEEADLIGEL